MVRKLEINVSRSSLDRHPPDKLEVWDGILATAPAEDETIFVYPLQTAVVILMTALICTVLTIIGNALFLLVFYFQNFLHQASDYLILSAATCGLVIGLNSPMQSAVSLILGRWPLGLDYCRLQHITEWTLFAVAQHAALLISTDQFLRVRLLHSYRVWWTKEIVLTFIFLSWTLAFGSIMTCYRLWSWEVEWKVGSKVTCEIGVTLTASICLSVIFTWTPFISMCSIGLYMYRRTTAMNKQCAPKQRTQQPTTQTVRPKSPSERQRTQQPTTQTVRPKSPSERQANTATYASHLTLSRAQITPRDVAPNSPSAECLQADANLGHVTELSEEIVQSRRVQKAFRTVSLLLGTFTVSYVPFASVMILIATGVQIPSFIFPVVTACGYIGTAISPFIYAYTNPMFKDALLNKNFFHRQRNFRERERFRNVRDRDQIT